MELSLKGFQQLVEDMGAALQSSATTLIDVSVGSVIRALFEANASVVLWMQWIILQVLQTTRASTSTGSDLDSWMLDFSLTRLPPVRSAGIVTFSRFASNISALIPVGTTVKTSDGSISFAVVADAALSTWQSTSSAYLLPSGVGSLDLPVTCARAGSVGNVLAGMVSVIASSVPGVDLVSNAAPFSNGTDAETDQALRSRFQNYLSSRSRATLAAIQSAIAGVQQGLDVLIEENLGISGLPEIGSFMVIVDDGTGTPSSDLLSSVSSAVDAVRPIGSTFAVVPPQVLVVNVALTVALSSTDVATETVSSIQNLVSAYLNGLPIGRSASVTRVAQKAYFAGVNVLNVTNIELNGGSVDIVTTPQVVIKAGQVTVITA